MVAKSYGLAISDVEVLVKLDHHLFAAGWTRITVVLQDCNLQLVRKNSFLDESLDWAKCIIRIAETSDKTSVLVALATALCAIFEWVG